MLLRSNSPDDSFTSTGSREVLLPLSGWSLRIDHSSGRLPSVAVHDSDGNCVDAMTPSLLAPTLLRDAWSGEHHGRPWTLAWGKGHVDMADFHVVFHLARHVRPVRPLIVADRFWVAETEDRYKHVTVFTDGPPCRLRARAA